MKRSVFSGRRRERFGNPSNPWVRKFMCCVTSKGWVIGGIKSLYVLNGALDHAPGHGLGDVSWGERGLMCSCQATISKKVTEYIAREHVAIAGQPVFFLRRSTSTSHQGRHCPAFYLKIPLIPIGATLSLNADVASSRAKVSMLSWHSISHFSSLFLRNTRCYTWRSHSVVLART